MSKKINRNYRSDYYEEDCFEDRGYHDELKERRKMKRLRNAIRSKNISDLLEFDDEY